LKANKTGNTIFSLYAKRIFSAHDIINFYLQPPTEIKIVNAGSDNAKVADPSFKVVTVI
jgi:hypothetical protein